MMPSDIDVIRSHCPARFASVDDESFTNGLDFRRLRISDGSTRAKMAFAFDFQRNVAVDLCHEARYHRYSLE
jgi:hypothetical protein